LKFEEVFSLEQSPRKTSIRRKRTGSKGEAEQGDSHIFPDYFFLNIYVKKKPQKNPKQLISSETFSAPCSLSCKPAEHCPLIAGV